MQRFEEAGVISELEVLPATLRVAFAAACAERQMFAYRQFDEVRGRPIPNALDLALQDTWRFPERPKDQQGFERRIEELMSFVPQEDDVQGPWTQDATNAQNAGMAAIYALRTRSQGHSREAAWAARVAYEALDSFVINSESVDTNSPGEELRVLAHPLVQAELARQRIDLDDLRTHMMVAAAPTIDRVRRRAAADASRFFRI